MMKMLLFLLEALLLATSVQAQIFGESLDQNYGPMFSSVDSDLDDNMFENFVDFSNGNFHNYEDQMVSESVMTEEQLTARQVKLRELYKGRRPVAKSGAGGIRMNFFNRLKENKRPRPAILGLRTEDKNITTNSTLKPEKLLDLHQSGMAVTVVKPPPDFVPQEPEDSKPEISKSSKRTKTSPFDWSRNKQKQRAALATSLIGSRLKDLKDKRKKLMNSNLVTERAEQRAEESEEDSGAQVLTVSIMEKSSETNNARFPTKKRRFKPQIKPTAGSQKWSIKEKIKNKNKLQVSSVTKGKTKEKPENVKNEANVKTIDLPHPTIKQDIKDQVEFISEELLNEVYKTSDNLTEEPVQSKTNDDQSNEEKPEWMKKPKKMGKPLKKINVEESAAPISIVPHGVPITRGFGTDEASRRVLVLPSAKPPMPVTSKEPPMSSKAPVPVTQAPSVTQFLQFLPFTPITEETDQPLLEPETRIIEETVETAVEKEEAVEVKEKAVKKTPENTTREENKKVDMEQSTNIISAESETDENNPEVRDRKMTADIINENIEKVLNVTMPKHTKLLYGTEEGRRVERDPSAQEVRLIYNWWF